MGRGRPTCSARQYNKLLIRFWPAVTCHRLHTATCLEKAPTSRTIESGDESPHSKWPRFRIPDPPETLPVQNLTLPVRKFTLPVQNLTLPLPTGRLPFSTGRLPSRREDFPSRNLLFPSGKIAAASRRGVVLARRGEVTEVRASDFLANDLHQRPVRTARLARRETPVPRRCSRGPRRRCGWGSARNG